MNAAATRKAANGSKHSGGTVFINARLIDPSSNRDEPGGLLVLDGKIADLGPHLRRNAPEGAEVIDCKGHVLAPGIVDAQVFTGEPGNEHRETLKTASHVSWQTTWATAWASVPCVKAMWLRHRRRCSR